MPHAFDPMPAAKLLSDAWESGQLLDSIPEGVRPRTLDQGYDVQDSMIALIGEPVVGWKLGVGSQKAKSAANLSRAIAGRVLKSRLFHSGNAVPMRNRAPVTIEFEIAYVLGQDVSPDLPIAVPTDAVAATHVAFEFVLSRFADRRAVGWPSFAGDNAAFSALVLGPEIEFDTAPEVCRSVTVSADGSIKAQSATGDDAIDPIVALSEMFAHARERQLLLPKGTIVSTGTQSVPFNTTGEPTNITASYVGGSLSASIAPTG